MPPIIRDGGGHCMRGKTPRRPGLKQQEPPKTPCRRSAALTRRSLFHRLAGLLAALSMPGLGRAETAATQQTKITFILVNDIYIMGDRLMPDGQRRGGFARLAAVVKAERERAKADGGHVIFAHAGDTLSPSLMSGLDRGAHIIALTNMIRARHLRAGQSRVRFRQGDFLSAHGGGEISALRRQPARRRRQAAAEFPGPLDHDVRRRAHRAHRRHLRRHAAHVEPRRPAIPADRSDHRRAGRAAAQGRRRLRGRGDACRAQAGLRDVRDPQPST